MDVVIRRKAFTVLELLYGGPFNEFPKIVTPQSHFPTTSTVLSEPKKTATKKSTRREIKKQGKEYDEFMSKVSDTLPMPNTRRCLYREGKLTYVIAPA
jgi:hypothetical protein